MKKILFLVLILSLTTFAQAGLVFTVNGEPQPAEITIRPSDTIELDLELSGDSTIFAYTLDYKIEGAGNAELIWDNTVFPTVFEFPAAIVAPRPDGLQVTASQFFGAALVGPLDLMKNLMLHCTAVDDPTAPTILNIYVSGATVVDGQELPIGLIHSLIINQIPEPMTMTLLGLGGLFLVRRKK